MKISVIKIGNSKGIRLAKAIIKKYEIEEEVEMILEEDGIKLKPVNRIREGWEEAFAKMAAQGDDELLIDDVLDDQDIEEWQ